jgi:hypothetical protein
VPFIGMSAPSAWSSSVYPVGTVGRFRAGAWDSGAWDSGAVDSGAVDSGAVDAGAVVGAALTGAADGLDVLEPHAATNTRTAAKADALWIRLAIDASS